ncbi:von Willebrand factor A domain-containing protein 5B1 [Brienomyrus brachyistius]|uniref:von Willebrand factor A domain-containing protein 5B1 n=1 Tax=Brienomyrus brachyistius TaxID=42636 RepID=UPI0020B1B229|nr:von Willebrand factor A domain-containing protein 5B1 [Brienomyrus brachyistius]
MPGLINVEKRSALPLSVSEITSCVRGYTLAMTASMTYNNFEDRPIEGIFIYPLDECSTVVGFEAMISDQIITLQIKDKTKIDDCYFDCCSTANEAFLSGAGRIVLDEDLERTVLVVNLGIIPPLETVNVLVSTSSELPTLPNGAIRVTSPPACTPKVQKSVSEDHCFSPSLARTSGFAPRRDRHHCTLSPHDQTLASSHLCLAWLLEEEQLNSIDYEFNFRLEIRGPCLLAGVESPTHAIRADAEASARSATNVVVTLADKYTYDYPVEIIIYLSEPHVPHVLIEDGDMMLEEYDEHLKGRSDFIKGTKKDSSNEKKVDILRKRLHKDILHNPVVMLNFCPDLTNVTSDLRRVQGEFIFLIDRSGSMSGINISRVRDAMVVALKSLVPACLFNIVGFGSTFKSLFPSSQVYGEETLAVACEYIRQMRADMGGTNILAPLSWILRQPLYRGHPRLLFLLTDGAVSNTGNVIELLRSHARFTRCYTFGIGQNACRRLVIGLSTVSRGTAEFLAEGERLQPKMVRSLKKSMSPVLSDISIDWLFPETKEVLLSPVGSTFLFPGDHLIGYSVVCDTTRYHPNPKSDKRRRYSMMRLNESNSSVFYHSQEEESEKTGTDSRTLLREEPARSPSDSYQEIVSEGSPVTKEQDLIGTDMKTSPRRRAYSTNQIMDYNPLRKVHTPSDPSSVMGKNPLRRTKIQELTSYPSQAHGAQWMSDYQMDHGGLRGDARTSAASLQAERQIHGVLAAAVSVDCGFQPQLASLCSSRCRSNAGQRPLQLQHEELIQDPEMDQLHQCASVHAVRGTAVEEDSRSSTDSPSVSSGGDPEGYTHQFCEFEMPPELFTPDRDPSKPGRKDCKAVVTALLCGKPVKWEVVFDIDPHLNGREREEKVHEDLWNETFHHLAGRSIIQDFEQMADKECEIEYGSSRRYQLYAIQTSKACNILSKYTAFVPIDLDTNEYLRTSIEYTSPGDTSRHSSHSGSRSGSRKNRTYSRGLGRSQSDCVSEGTEEGLMPIKTDYNEATSPSSTSSPSGWERFSFNEVLLRSSSTASEHSQRSVESLFSARLSLSRVRMLTRAAQGFMCRSPRTSESMADNENESKDYIPLVSLQLACGAFLLNNALCEAINVPMDKLRWTSPFASHRGSVVHVSQCSSRGTEGRGKEGSRRVMSPPEPRSKEEAAGQLVEEKSSSQPHCMRRPQTEIEPSLLTASLHGYVPPEPPHSPANSQTDSGRGSESEGMETPPGRPGSLWGFSEPEGALWATAVALACLEHGSASYFIEWELVAAKASMWLSSQPIPEGRDLASVKAAANQLFVILRHWDENLQLNMLCYNPNSV